MEHARIGKIEWLRAARIALLDGGPAAVRVEKLASNLGVTKGSFYWHFRDRNEILEALLAEWEDETSTLAAGALGKGDPREAISSILDELKERILSSERGEAPSDAAIFAWASVSPKVNKRVNKIEKRRLELLTRLSGRPDRAEFAYLALIGFLMRRRRVPETAKGFPQFAGLVLDFLIPGEQPQELNPNRARNA